MYKRKRIWNQTFLKCVASLFLLLFGLGKIQILDSREAAAFFQQAERAGWEKAFHTMAPLFAFVQSSEVEADSESYFYGVLEQKMPLAAYAKRNGFALSPESRAEYELLLRLEGTDEEAAGDALNMDEAKREAFLKENEQAAAHSRQAEQEEKQENAGRLTETEAPAEEAVWGGAPTGEAVWSGPPVEKQTTYSLEEYREYEKLIKEFYAVDPTTMADETLLNVDTLLHKNMRLKAGGEEPQILIYHTHSQENFADSIPDTESMTVVGVGDYLAKLLEERYGFRVLHHKGQYDVEKRDYAYTKAAPALEQLLQENPSIQVVIDLHRDEVPEDTKLLMELNGKPTARLMFFNGLSRTKKTGEIAYLKNPYIDDNLAFAFQMQLACNEYYPGLTRKIYLKGYRYNMHYCPKTLLVELGAQTNTTEEAYNACEPLADMLAKVLLGE